MKYIKLIIVYTTLILLSSCRQEAPQTAPDVVADIIGTWESAESTIIITEDSIDGYPVVIDQTDWTILTQSGIIIGYELLHSDESDFLILNNYQYKKQ